MATEENTSSATAPTRKPHNVAIDGNEEQRPMLCHSDDAMEATSSVRNVLLFMAAALGDGFDFGGNREMLDGASLILETCADTLSHYLPDVEKGGAI